MLKPKNAVVVLLDSLNRHLLGCYGSDEFATPNLGRLAARSTRFTRHVVGGLPCMPARHDLLVGAYDFLWRPWGSIEVWEDALTLELRKAGLTTMLITDHPHLFEAGGENYHCDFSAWDYVRGHENDPWRTVPDPTFAGAPALPARRNRVPFNYDTSRTWFREEADYPGPKVMKATSDWLDLNAGKHHGFLLVVDEFDPHEPFDTPEPWASMYDSEWTGERIIWPPYSRDTLAKGVLTEREGAHVRANYGAKLSMIDHWFGKVLDAFDRNQLWDDTALILCTDHGHYLCEHDYFGKPAVPIMEEMGHIPLMVAWPGHIGGGVCDALTTTVDIHATLLEIFGVTAPHRTHGVSILPLLDGTASSIREWAVSGMWGREVNVTDGRWMYTRGPNTDNRPLAVWSNRWSTMPINHPLLRMPRPNRKAGLDFMPGSDVPVIRQPYAADETLPFWAQGRIGGSHLWDVVEDPAQTTDRIGEPQEKQMLDLLVGAMRAVEAPKEQFERLGIA